MKLCEILNENAAAGSVGGGAVAGFRGNLFAQPMDRSRIPNVKKIKKIQYSKRNNWTELKTKDK